MTETYKIFAYGSLIHQGSLKSTVPEARNIFPAGAYGLQRVFNLASSYRFDDQQQAPVCVLSAEAGYSDQLINGACFEMDEVSLDRLLHRERGYDFCKIKAHHYHDKDNTFDAYYFRAKVTEPYLYLSGSLEQQHYLDLCLSGSAGFGPDFVDDFKCSTSFWGIEDEHALQAIWEGRY